MAKFMNVISSKILKVSTLGILIASVIAGCGISSKNTQLDLPPPTSPQFKPKQVEERARGITIAKSVLYNCKILGETEGKDNAQIRAERQKSYYG